MTAQRNSRSGIRTDVIGKRWRTKIYLIYADIIFPVCGALASNSSTVITDNSHCGIGILPGCGDGSWRRTYDYSRRRGVGIAYGYRVLVARPTAYVPRGISRPHLIHVRSRPYARALRPACAGNARSNRCPCCGKKALYIIACNARSSGIIGSPTPAYRMLARGIGIWTIRYRCWRGRRGKINGV